MRPTIKFPFVVAPGSFQPSSYFFAFVFLVNFLPNLVLAQSMPVAPISITHQFMPDVFPLVHNGQATPIFIDEKAAEVIRISANALSKDVALVSGKMPAVNSGRKWPDMPGYAVIIGTIGESALVDNLVGNKKLAVGAVQNKWESFSLTVVDNPFGNVNKALVIAGSDRRGTAFGVFELSRQLGISPWYWWADVVPRHQDNIYLQGSLVEGPPAVKYRGIFLNDEDWGLQPWAATNQDTDVKDIGPNTYARIFELLLRLKANLIWPAMHPSTKAFFSYAGNPKMADAYAILVGTSHAEPMLRNNVDEWKEKTMGAFDYFKNQQVVYTYWEERVKAASGMEAIYSLGMRGVHDSGMVGAKNAAEAAGMVGKIITDQRLLLKKHVNPDVTTIPQAFTAYKEVLDIYDQGLKLPEDITLVWPDDNYGYIHRLSNARERQRPGGSGIYYHASYWGRPHDYLWLSSTHPALIRSEMMKAFNLKANNLWVLNVGDIKPLEYNIQLFLDMAYRSKTFQAGSSVKDHLETWAGNIFGPDKGKAIGTILWQYYDLAFERRPEFMGWSRTEPTTPTNFTQYNHFYYGDEAQRRLDQYEALENSVKALRNQVSPEQTDAFYQLVYYPVVGASLINKKFLYRDKSHLYAKQNRASARDYARLAQKAYTAIVQETDYYNNQLANGKWKNMMSMKPRNLPVYQEPALPQIKTDSTYRWGLAPEGFVTPDSSRVLGPGLTLPTFSPAGSQKYFIDVFLTSRQPVSWKVTASPKWIKLLEKRGKLTDGLGQKEQRLWVSIDWQRVPPGKTVTGFLTFKGAGRTFRVEVNATHPAEPGLATHTGFSENNGYISMFAQNFSRQTNSGVTRWSLVDGFGHTGKSLVAWPLLAEPLANITLPGKDAAMVAYDFYSFTETAPVVHVFTLPTHPVTSQTKLRYAVALDDQPAQVVDFQTFGRSEEWKVNVLENRARREVKFGQLAKGKHTLKIYLIDPGVVLDRIIIDLGGLQPAYSTIPETKNQP